MEEVSFLPGGVTRRRTPRTRRPLPSLATDAKSAAQLLRHNVRRGEIEGACLDTGASRSVVGREQAKAYARLPGRRLVLAPPAMTTFLFRSEEHASLGTLPMHVPLSQAYYLLLSVVLMTLVN